MQGHRQLLHLSKDSGIQPRSSFLEVGALHLTAHIDQRHQLPMQMQPLEGTGLDYSGSHEPLPEGSHSTLGGRAWPRFTKPVFTRVLLLLHKPKRSD